MRTGRTPAPLVALIVPAVAVVAIVATALSDGNDDRTDTEVNTIVIEDFAYAPPRARVPAGTAVRVTNSDDAAHTLSAEDDSFDTGELADGEEASLLLKTPGRYEYFCRIHEYMTGVIDVDRP